MAKRPSVSQIVDLIDRLAIRFPAAGLSPARKAILAKEWVEDLEDISADELARSERIGRKRWEFFPTPPEILRIVSEIRAIRGQAGARLSERPSQLTDAEWQRNQECVRLAVARVNGEITQTELEQRYRDMGIPVE